MEGHQSYLVQKRQRKLLKITVGKPLDLINASISEPNLATVPTCIKIHNIKYGVVKVSSQIEKFSQSKVLRKSCIKILL